MRPLLLLRADAGGATGSGHVMRMLALAAAWADAGGASALASFQIPTALAARAAEAGVDVAPLDTPAWDAAGATRLRAIAEGRGARAVAIDSYLAQESY